MFESYTVDSTFFNLQFSALAPNIFFCISNHQTTSLFFFLHLSSSGRFKNITIQLTFIRRILFKSILLFPIRSNISSSVIFYGQFISSNTKFRSSPNTSAPIFLVPGSLSLTNHCSNRNIDQFLP